MLVHNYRITPAYAGKTPDSQIKLCRCWDHPRMCGKDSRLSRPSLAVAGSPPHVRERLTGFPNDVSGIGITPACAGKTTPILPGRLDAQDHPRMCGKDVHPRPFLPEMIGSPPHVRERLASKYGYDNPDGITPACAGKTAGDLRAVDPCGDHPRMCGKDLLSCFGEVTNSGSPPHVRERLNIDFRGRVYPRITPACAGKT